LVAKAANKMDSYGHISIIKALSKVLPRFYALLAM